MILIDFNQIMHANIAYSFATDKNVSHDMNENLLRHMVLKSLKFYRDKFRNTYGELVIASDGTNYWRRQYFPYYKANRKKNREESTLDWKQIFESLNKIRAEIKEFLPYKLIHLEGVEADDVIATLIIKGNENIINNDKFLIISNDKDFKQLQTYGNVYQFNPIKKAFVKESKPSLFLKEQIMRGDVGDGIPNFLSPDASLVNGERQKPISSKKLELWLKKDPKEFCDENMLRNFRRNETLIDFNQIPENVTNKILDDFNSQESDDRSKLFNYFVNNRLKNLMEYINDF